jgi:hypothetical protein
MAVNLSPVGGVAGQFFDNNGNPLAGGKIFTYSAGTTTNQATYTSATGAIAHSNPIILDGAGRVPSGEIWLTDGLEYKFVIKDNVDALIGTFDNIIGINSNFVNFTNQQELQTATAGQTVFTLTTMQYQPATNSLSVFVDGVNQYGPGALYAYVETDSTTVTFTAGLHVGAEVKFTTSNLNSSAGGDASQIAFTGFKSQIGNVQNLAGDDGADWIGFEADGLNAVARSAQDKMRDTVSVKDFGAIAYATQGAAFVGAAANTAIAAAIAALPATGGIIEFPGQYYRLDGTVRIEKTGVIFKGKGGGIQTGLLQTQDVESVYVDNAPAQSPPFGVEFHDLWFIGYRNTSTSTEGGFAALRIDDAFLCRVSNCYFEHGRHGLQLTNAGDIFIENCFFEDQPQMLVMVGCNGVIANNLSFINPNGLNSLVDSYAINFNSTTVECQFNNIKISGQSSASKLAIGVQLVGARNEISNVYVENATTHGVVLTGATCSGNALSNFSIYGSGNGLRLQTSATNNSIANINLSGNTAGLNVATDTGSGNSYANINTFSNTTAAIIAEAVAATQLFTAANFQLRSGTTANRPGSGLGKTTGYMYFDTTLGIPIWWNAPNWVDATGATV